MIKQFSLYVLKMQEEAKWQKDFLKNMLQMDLKHTVQEQNLSPKSIQLQYEAMKELGIDISKQKSKELTDEMISNSDNIVNMGCMDKKFCPTIWLPKVIEWNLEDPKGKLIEEVREIRDEIEKRVKELVAEITTTTQ